jgi:SLOG in TRPM, prokaryote
MLVKITFGELTRHSANKQSFISDQDGIFMHTQLEHPRSDRREINFSNGNRAQALVVPLGAQADDMASVLGIQAPRNVILITGGASTMDKESDNELFPLLMNGIVRPATALDALILDGGTQTGVMALIGLGVAQQQHRPTLLGVAADGMVLYPGKTTGTNEHAVPLDPNHSHFILVETDTWGQETKTMYELVRFLSREHASVAILVNGGEIARKEALYNVRQGRPLIIIEGSGRTADEIAHAMHDAAFSSSYAELAEIIAKGDLHLFPLNGPAKELEQLLLRLLKRK